MPDFDWGYDLEDVGFKLARAGGGRGIARSGGGGGGGGLSSGGGPGFVGGSGGLERTVDPQRRKKVIERLLAAIQSMQGDSVDANLTPGEYVSNPMATAEHFPTLERWNRQGNAERDYFLGGLVDMLPLPEGFKGPAKRGLEFAGTAGLTAMGVPAPLAAAGSNLAVRGGEADDFTGALGNAAMAGGTNYGMGQLRDMEWRGDMEAMNRRNLEGLQMPEPDFLEPEGYANGGYVRRPGYAYGGYVGRQWGQPGPQAYGRRGAAPADARPPQTPPGAMPTPMNYWNNPGGVAGQAGAGIGQAHQGLGQAWQRGMFDPGGNPMAMQAAVEHLNRQGQAEEAGDVNELYSLGLGDPNLVASQLMGRRGERARTKGLALAGIAENQANRSQDFYQQLWSQLNAGDIQNYLAQAQLQRDKALKGTKGKK